MGQMQEAQVQSVTYVPQKYEKEPLSTEFRVALGPAVYFLHPPKREITNRTLKHPINHVGPVSSDSTYR